MNQVPLIVYNVFLGMEGVINVALLQLKDPASSQRAFMLSEGNPTLQGSKFSTCTESTRVGTASLCHLSGLPNPDKASSFSTPNFVIVF